MKLASLGNEACFMCQWNLLRWATKPVAFLGQIVREYGHTHTDCTESTDEPNSALLLEVFNEHEYLKSTRIEKCWSKEHKPNKHPGGKLSYFEFWWEDIACDYVSKLYDSHRYVFPSGAVPALCPQGDKPE